MAGNTFIAIPPNVTDPTNLKRFLNVLVEKLDIAFGNRGTESFASASGISASITNITELIDAINEEILEYSRIDGTRDFTGIVGYNEDKTFTSDTDIIAKKYVDDNFMPLDASEPFTDIVSYDDDKTFVNDTDIIAKKYVDDNFTNNPKQAAIANLGLTISNPPTQAQVQAVSNKVDAILAALRSANIIN